MNIAETAQLQRTSSIIATSLINPYQLQWNMRSPCTFKPHLFIKLFSLYIKLNKSFFFVIKKSVPRPPPFINNLNQNDITQHLHMIIAEGVCDIIHHFTTNEDLVKLLSCSGEIAGSG